MTRDIDSQRRGCRGMITGCLMLIIAAAIIIGLIYSARGR